MENQDIINQFAQFDTGNEGIESLVSKNSNPVIVNRLSQLDQEPLNKVQLNQLLVLSYERGVSDAYYLYYWFKEPIAHPYDVKKLPYYDSSYNKIRPHAIKSIEHLKWGLYRIYVDGLLYFGNVRYSYKQLSYRSETELESFFKNKYVNTDAIKDRGPALPLKDISRDNRYLISEMACKSYGDDPIESSKLKQVLIEAFQNNGDRKTKIGNLLDGAYTKEKYPNDSQHLLFSANEILEEEVDSISDIEVKYLVIAEAFKTARKAALENTKLYLSVVNDLDVYVATSMRTREDFRKMARDCEAIFNSEQLKELHLRYFDPTRSAADGHQDKGLIECLMVKCAKVLVYCAGKKESYGKDAEAAMALSLGKTVIFYCDEEQKGQFYKEVHPLSRLIDFSTGVATGAIVTSSLQEVSTLLLRIFENKLEYEFEQPKKGYLHLKEKMTNSIVRLQTNNQLLSKAFWNYYNSQLIQ